MPTWPNVPQNLDAVVDSPFTHHWKMAELLYPNARLITTRQYESWIASCDRWMGDSVPQCPYPHENKNKERRRAN